jgi:hypothetical protein
MIAGYERFAVCRSVGQGCAVARPSFALRVLVAETLSREALTVAIGERRLVEVS